MNTGDRARFWVLDAGPNRASSFHIVGGQFDTMYIEGSYLLKDGRDAFGTENGGAQAMGLRPPRAVSSNSSSPSRVTTRWFPTRWSMQNAARTASSA
ncbi:MAG: hypothetical protein R2722_10795 [Tessaracoccus sp.]